VCGEHDLRIHVPLALALHFAKDSPFPLPFPSLLRTLSHFLTPRGMKPVLEQCAFISIGPSESSISLNVLLFLYSSSPPPLSIEFTGIRDLCIHRRNRKEEERARESREAQIQWFARHGPRQEQQPGAATT
jgi:hypothetical protein